MHIEQFTHLSGQRAPGPVLNWGKKLNKRFLIILRFLKNNLKGYPFSWIQELKSRGLAKKLFGNTACCYLNSLDVLVHSPSSDKSRLFRGGALIPSLSAKPPIQLSFLPVTNLDSPGVEITSVVS